MIAVTSFASGPSGLSRTVVAGRARVKEGCPPNSVEFVRSYPPTLHMMRAGQAAWPVRASRYRCCPPYVVRSSRPATIARLGDDVGVCGPPDDLIRRRRRAIVSTSVWRMHVVEPRRGEDGQRRACRSGDASAARRCGSSAYRTKPYLTSSSPVRVPEDALRLVEDDRREARRPGAGRTLDAQLGAAQPVRVADRPAGRGRAACPLPRRRRRPRRRGRCRPSDSARRGRPGTGR